MKIILANDGSDDAIQAARFFSRLPHDQPLEVTVMTVLDASDVFTSTPSEAWYPDFVEQQKEMADQSYGQVAAIFEGANATLRSLKPQGHAGEAIVQQAATEKTDLIVIGAKGHSAIERVLLGSVSQFVATHADCSVLVVRPPAPGHEADETLRVTIAYDSSASSEAAIEQFAQFGWTANVLVEVLSVFNPYRPFRQDLTPPALEHAAKERRTMGEKAEQLAARLKQRHIHATSRVVNADHVGEAIVTISQEYESRMIVVGSTGRRLLPRVVLGSVSSYVLRHAKQSVWIARQRKR